MHPSSQIEREYAVRVNGRASDEVLDRLRNGVELEDGLAKFDRLRADGHSEGSNQWYRVVVKQGRNRVVRRLWESQDLQVSRLIRTRYGSINMPKWLGRGKMEFLGGADIDALAKSAGVDDRPADKLRIVPVHPRHKRKAKRKR